MHISRDHMQVPPSQRGNPSVACLSSCFSQTLRAELDVPSVGALGGDERCVEYTVIYLHQCPCSQSDFIGRVKKYWGLICKQRLPLKLDRQVDSKQLFV